MLHLTAIHFTKAELDLIPADHRLAYFGICQIADETAILLRTAISAINSGGPADPAYVRDMSNATALLATRLLAGRLFEARQFINSREVAVAFRELSGLAAQHDQRVGPSLERARVGRAALFRLINASRLIGPLRNRAAFHAEMGLIEEAYDQLPVGMNFVDYIGSTRGNSIFGGAESLHLTALSALVGQGDVPDFDRALAQTVREVGEAVGYLGDFTEGFVSAFILAHLGVERLQGDRIAVPSAVPIDELRLPLFSTHPREAS